MKETDKVISIDYYKAKKETIIHYRNNRGEKRVVRKKLMTYPIYVPIERFQEFKKVCGDLIEFVGQKSYYSYDRNTELLKLDMDGQNWMEKKFDRVRTKLIKKFNLHKLTSILQCSTL